MSELEMAVKEFCERVDSLSQKIEQSIKEEIEFYEEVSKLLTV